MSFVGGITCPQAWQTCCDTTFCMNASLTNSLKENLFSHDVDILSFWKLGPCDLDGAYLVQVSKQKNGEKEKLETWIFHIKKFIVHYGNCCPMIDFLSVESKLSENDQNERSKTRSDKNIEGIETFLAFISVSLLIQKSNHTL